MPATASTTTLVLLILEDSPADLELTKHAPDQTGLPLTVLAARDGEEAMTLLRTVRPPDLILLDLNLPRRTA
jgi:CheY-like chemotaxis protein